MDGGTVSAGRGVDAATGPRWWESRWCALAAVALAFVPLLYPPVPPLVDLLGHLGRYAVLTGLDRYPTLQPFYGFHWAPMGNLGVDALVALLAPMLGLEPAVKLIVLAIPPLTVAGYLWVAREVHGRLPPTALATIPFAFAHPFLHGFVNFALAMALAMLGFGLWLALSRRGQFRLRAALFAPLSLLLYFTHAFGWGVLGLLACASELIRLRDEGRGWWAATVGAALNVIVLALPVAAMLAWRSGISGGNSDWFRWDIKMLWLAAALRDRWRTFDLLSVAAVVALIVEALRNGQLGFSRRLVLPALVLGAAFLVIPRILMTSAYADMRLVPTILALLVLAIRPRPGASRRLLAGLAIASALFAVVRVAGTTASVALAADGQRERLAALDHLPDGARVASFVSLGCDRDWPLLRDAHLGAFVIARRHGFSNDQWAMPGLNLLDVRYRAPGDFAFDPSQIVRPNACPDGTYRTVDQALGEVPRNAFDYLWLIDVDGVDPARLSGLFAVWQGPGSKLFRIERTTH